MENNIKFSDLFKTFLKIGFISFGGPMGQIALMHKEIIEDKKWIKEDEFLSALNFCHLLPGPEAQQLATYIGWKLHGTKGGLASGLLFIIPGAIIMLMLSLIYVSFGNTNWFKYLFIGIQASVLAIIIQALIRITSRSLKNQFHYIIAILSFIALYFFAAPFPIIILTAAILGIAITPNTKHAEFKIAQLTSQLKLQWQSSLLSLITWLFIWSLPFIAIVFSFGKQSIFFDIAAFFSKLAVTSFGGAYAVLTYMAQEAVYTYNWVDAKQMIDGLGLAETTPGPLILVTQFIGFLAGYGDNHSISNGIIASLIVLWVIFAPCFLYIFTFAPWIELLNKIEWLKGALSAISAAIVGVIANLSLWFALHILFNKITNIDYSIFKFSMPELLSFNPIALLLSAIAAFLIFKQKLNIIYVLAINAGLALVLSVLGFV